MTPVICANRLDPVRVIRGYNAGMQASQGEVEGVLRVTPVFRKLAPQDLHTIAQAATVKRYEKGQVIFEQETPSDAFYTIASGRVKIFKMLPTGKDMILEIFGAGDPLGAVAAYDGRPFPASAVALEDTACVVIPRADLLPSARGTSFAGPRPDARTDRSGSSS